MPDVSTALLSASTKPLFKMILKLRPGKLKKLAADAELQVTGLLFEGTAFIDDEAEFAHILLGRAEVDAARLETRASSWKKNGIRYIKITYRYYASATALLRQTKNATEQALRKNGPEGQRASRMACQATDATPNRPPVPMTSGTITSCTTTIENVLLRPGDNMVVVRCPADIPQLASIIVSMRPRDAVTLAGPSQSSGEDASSEDGRSVTVTITPTTEEGSDKSEDQGQDGDEDDSDCDLSVEASFSLSRHGGHQRWHVRGETTTSSTDIDVDITELDVIMDNCC